MVDVNEKKDICFIILPGLAPDAVPIFPLRDYFEAQGYPVITSNFWGEGAVSDFSALTIERCLAGIGGLVHEAKKRHRYVIGVGVSLGGALLIEHAKTHTDVDCIVSIGTPFALKNKFWIWLAFYCAPVLHPLWKLVSPGERRRPFPEGALPMTLAFFEQRFAAGLDRVKTPTLFIHGKKDPVADYRAVVDSARAFRHAPTKILFEKNGNHAMYHIAAMIKENIFEFWRSAEAKAASGAGSSRG